MSLAKKKQLTCDVITDHLTYSMIPLNVQYQMIHIMLAMSRPDPRSVRSKHPQKEQPSLDVQQTKYFNKYFIGFSYVILFTFSKVTRGPRRRPKKLSDVMKNIYYWGILCNVEHLRVWSMGSISP